MKIAFIAPDGLSVVLFCKTILKTLKTIPNAEVTVICDAGDYDQEIESLGVKCVNIAAYRFFSISEDLKYLWKLKSFFSENKVDIVFTFCTKQNIYGTLGAVLAGVPKVYSHVVGLGTAFLADKDLKGKIVSGFTSMLYKIVGKVARKIWFTNKNDLAFFRDNKFIDPEKTVLTPNYLDVSDYKLDTISEEDIKEAKELCKVAPNEIMIIMVARLIWAKGIKEFVETAISLHKLRPEFKFILVAPEESGSFGAVPTEYVLEAESKANFMWLGFQKKVKPLYAIADLAVLPTFYKEGGYPRALLEPMAMGKPVITTDSEDCRGAVEDGKNGYLIPVKNSKALEEAIVKILDDDKILNEFGDYSRVKAVRDFDESIIVPGALRQMGLIV
jgi:N,N'-diacetylbacillosaminyl-diphospho-undecaprenol alpha-1,3-N-acetylgalactosaminyltransferase